MQINGVEYGRAKIGTDQQWSKKQNRFVAGNGTARVSDRSTEERLITFTLERVSVGLFFTLYYFLTQTAGYARNTFQVIDDWGLSYTVRWWDSRLRFTEKAGRIYSVTITVRVET